MRSILIVDDEYAIRRTLNLLLKDEGYEVREAVDCEGAQAILAREPTDLVIADLRLKDSDGMDLLRSLRTSGSDAECIIMTAHGSIENAVEAMRLGAYDYLTKPVNPKELALRVRKVMEKKALSEEVVRLRDELFTRGRLQRIVAESPAMRRIIELVGRIRRHDIPVLITGQTGTGKEVVARAVHAASHRAQRPFLAVNCCALPEDLLDSELFGHVKGAFTGATSDAKGLFQLADGGTLFLDEIGDVSLSLQAKLLRVLQEGEVRPVGGGRPSRVDVRIVAATNRDLEASVAAGEFRSDLFFRLNVLPIAIPTLAERPEDVPALIDHFLADLRRRLDAPGLALTPAARRKLAMYSWPGNVRQLENVLERGFALSEGEVLDAPEILFDYGQPSAASQAEAPAEDPVELPLEAVIDRHVQRVLDAHGGNQVAAAKALGISRSTLRRKLGLPC